MLEQELYDLEVVEESSVVNTSPASVDILTRSILTPISKRYAFAEAALNVVEITFLACTEPFVIEDILFALTLVA